MNSEQALFRFIPASSASSSSSSALLARLSASIPELGRSPGETEEEEEGAPIPSSSTGITRRLLADLTSTNPTEEAAEVQTQTQTHLPTGTAVGVLLLFAAEGDNRPDAHYLAGAVAELLRATREETETETGPGTERSSKGQAQGQSEAPMVRFTEPPSWAGLFGNGFDQALFG